MVVLIESNLEKLLSCVVLLMESNLEKVSRLGEPRSVALKESYLEKLSKKEFSAPPPLYRGEVAALEAGEPGTESSNPNGLFF